MTEGTAAPGPAQRDPAEADGPGLARLELVQPRVVPRGVLGRVRAVVARVPQPQLGVLRDVLHLALHDPGVAPARHPGPQPVLPVLALHVLPVGEELRVPALVQPLPRLLNERAAQIVPAHPAVAVGQPGAGRDHEGRVGHDQVVRLVVAHRLEEGALAQVGRGRAGQGQGEPR